MHASRDPAPKPAPVWRPEVIPPRGALGLGLPVAMLVIGGDDQGARDGLLLAAAVLLAAAAGGGFLVGLSVHRLARVA